jgi:presenilin 1
MIIGATLLFVILFKFGCWKILHGYLFLTVVMLLGFMGYLLALNVIQVLSIPVDLITLVFALYNFAVVGIVAVFSTAPLWLQQTYLVLMSSIMAFSLTGLDAWTTWLLLGILAIWDLIAVLCPYGPLRVLVETSQQENREIPALLYSVTMVWITMATPAADEAITNNSDGGDLSKQKPRAETSAITNDNVRKSTCTRWRFIGAASRRR